MSNITDTANTIRNFAQINPVPPDLQVVREIAQVDRDAGRQIAEPKRTWLLGPVLQRRTRRIVLGLIVVVSSVPVAFVTSAPQERRTTAPLSETKRFSQTNDKFGPLDRHLVIPDIEDESVSSVIQLADWNPSTAPDQDQLTQVASTDEVVPSRTSEEPSESKFWDEDESFPDEADLPPLPSEDSIPAPIQREPVAYREKQAWQVVRESQGWKVPNPKQSPAESVPSELISKTPETVRVKSSKMAPSEEPAPIPPLPSSGHSLDFEDDVPHALNDPLRPLSSFPSDRHSLDFAPEASPQVQVISNDFQMSGPIAESLTPVVSSPVAEMSPIQQYGNSFGVPNPPQVSEDYHNWGPIRKFQYFNQTNGDVGIGHERVMFAPFEIETSQPANNVRLKMMSAFGLLSPDRASYIWAPIGSKGPPNPESHVDYQNFNAIYEAGGKRFSMVTDIPLRSLHPDNNSSGSGIGNISLAPKAVLVDGSDWQVTHIFRTYLPTGPVQRGTTNGLTSLEPGLLVHYRWSPETYVHGQVKYWIPIAAGPGAGNVFNYGVGVSHVLHETDSFAIIPVLEVVGWGVAGGTVTLPTLLPTPVIQESASTSFVNIQPGVRFVIGPKGDLGLFEFGVSGGFATNTTGWYKEQLTLEMRWSW